MSHIISPNVKKSNKKYNFRTLSEAISAFIWFNFMNLSSFFPHPLTHTCCNAAPIFILYVSLLLHSSSSLFLCVMQPAIPSVPPRFLTSGSWDVTLLCALDEKAGKMYVRATVSGAGLNQPSAPLTPCSSLL